MWSARRWTALLGGLGVAFAVVSFLGASSAHAASNPGCPAHLRPAVAAPADSCSLPSGPSVDPCSVVTFGRTHCPIHTPDLNPADWAGWLGCELLNSILVPLGNAIVATVDSTLSAITDLVLTPIRAVATFIGSLFDVIAAFGARLGPLAPVVVVGGAILVAIAVIVVVYLVLIALIAAFKTLFNLL